MGERFERNRDETTPRFLKRLAKSGSVQIRFIFAVDRPAALTVVAKRRHRGAADRDLY
jgi:hypothetical protein